MTSIEVMHDDHHDHDSDVDIFPQSKKGMDFSAESTVEAQKTPEEIEREHLYEMGKERVFNYIEPLRKKVKKLTQSVKEVENTDEYEYTKRLADLRLAESSLNGIEKFEHKLWGDSVDAYLESRRTMGADVKSIRTRADIEHFFEEWGALPAASDLERPFVHKDVVLDFVDTVSDLSEEEANKRAEELFSNPTVRETMLSFRMPEEGIYERGMAVTDGSLEEDETEYVFQDKENAERNLEPEEIPSTPEVSTYDRLVEEENKLIEAKHVIASKAFRFAPFLMKFTKKGKEQLKLLQEVGLDKKKIGRSGGNLEIARALRLKAIREKLSHMDEQSKMAFSHSDQLRENIVKRPKSGRTIEQIKEDAILDHEIKTKDTRRRNVSNIKKKYT